MNISLRPIFSTDDRMLCHISYTDDDGEWSVRTSDGRTITHLTLTPPGAYAHFEVPRDEVEDDVEGLAYRLCTVDMDGEFCPIPGEREHMKLQSRRIRNALGRQICKLSLNEEDGTWSLIFYGKHYSTILYLYSTGAYTQLEIPSDLL